MELTKLVLCGKVSYLSFSSTIDFTPLGLLDILDLGGRMESVLRGVHHGPTITIKPNQGFTWFVKNKTIDYLNIYSVLFVILELVNSWFVSL
jgi:hypothetical protein